MSSRTRTFATIFTVVLAATLVGALVTTRAESPSRPLGAGDATGTKKTVPVALQASEAPVSVGLNTFRDIAREVNGGVVNINTEKLVERPRMPFHDFFGQDPRRSPEDSDDQIRQRSLGSGFVIDADGFILTNRHVVEGADTIDVTFPDGTDYEAEIVGQDARTDVALLKIEPEGALTVVPLGDSDTAQPGEWVMAIGNPFRLGNSVSVGVVSYIGRDIALQRFTSIEMIQTDAAINPGNSGGPLLNTRGEVIGINTMIVTDGASRVNAGVGFSVPINVAKSILPQLRDRGKVIRGWMGVRIRSMSEDLAATYDLDESVGAVVLSVDRGSPAEAAGIEPEDVILAADDERIGDNGDLTRYIASKPPGTEVALEVLRGGERRNLSVTLGTFPDDPRSPAVQEATDRPRLGMSVRDLTPALAQRLRLPEGTRGVLITDVETGEPAEEAGLRANFVIVSVNGETVESVDDFERAVTGFESGDRIRLRVLTPGAEGGYAVVVLRLK